jgi:hypothetical protein
MRIRHPLCPLWFIVLINFGCSSSGTNRAADDASAGVVNFADTKSGLRLRYPGDWREKHVLFQPKNVIVLLQPLEHGGLGKLPQTVSVVAQDATKVVGPSDLPAMEQRLIEKATKEIGDFKLVETADTTVAGERRPAGNLFGTKLGVRLEVMNVITTHAGRGYAVAYMADPAMFDEGRPAVDKVVESIEFSQ